MTAAGRRAAATSEVQDRLEAIFERVRRSLADNVSTIDTATRHLATGALDEGERRAAESAAHRVAGAAETIGFPEATAPARRLENAFADADPAPERARRVQKDAAVLHRIILGSDDAGS